MNKFYDLYLFNYNNYKNRQIKRLETLEEYIALAGFLGGIQNINMVTGDGVNVEQIINWTGPEPDYMVAVDWNNAISRWFVIESEKTRGGQYKLTLRRDVVADNIQCVLNSPCFIQKATIPDTDPFIFNDEGMKVNQVLRSQTKLKDELGMAWLCAYVPKHSDSTTWEQTPVNASVSSPSFNYEFADDEELLEAIQADRKYLNSYDIVVKTYPYNYVYHLVSKNNRSNNSSYRNQAQITDNWYRSNGFDHIDSEVYNAGYVGIIADGTYVSANAMNDIKYQYNNKIIKKSDSLYMLTLKEKKTTTTGYQAVSSSQLYSRLYDAMDVEDAYGNTNDIVSVSSIEYIELEPVLTPYLDNSASFTISEARRSTLDQAFDIICFPYPIEATTSHIEVAGSTITIDRQAMLNIATKLSTTWGSDVVYDVQILPYCPVRDLIVGNDIEVSAGGLNSKYSLVKNGDNETIGICFYCLTSSGTFNIEYPITYTGGKLQIMTEMYRLCDPNYTSAYELRPFENYGIDYFNVDFTYLPYQPYIKINPNYKGLNGIESDDNRGLILGGNYSITTLSSQWANYQLNNTNYQVAFDRQIKNAKTNYKYNLIENVASGIIGGVGSSVASGIATGNVGVGVAMGVANAGGLGADIALSKAKFKESQSYAKDMFNYNLQNIQARPETISKITSFNYNSMYFPFVEYYSCTDEEKEAVRMKLQYNGMTIMRVGLINDYIQADESYIQGEIIRLVDFNNDYHMAVELCDEIKRGIYISRRDV